MTSWKLPLIHLPEGDERDLWIDEGRFTTAPIDRATPLPGRFALPGLVDAHAHFALRAIGDDHQAGDGEDVLHALRANRDAGVLLVRDVGAPKSVTLTVRRDDTLPQFIPAGRWHAPAERFMAPFHDPVAADQLVSAVREEIGRGATWVKVVADWRTPELSYPLETLRAVVDAAHAAGARVAVHTQWAHAGDLVTIGVDSIEHGCLLDEGALREMAARGCAWTPTLTAFNGPLPDDLPAERVAVAMARLDNYRAMLPVAARLGVTILAGTDTVGSVADEVGWLIRYGLEPIDALRAATSAARTFLGAAALEDGAAADVITFDADPRADPDVLARPVAVVLRGVRYV